MKEVWRCVGWIMLVFAIVFLFGTHNSYAVAFKEPVDISQCYPEEYTNLMAVETELSMLLGRFARYEEGDYYAVPIFAEDEIYYVGLTGDSQTRRYYSQILDESIQSGLEGKLKESIKFQGRLKEMNDGVYMDFKGWFAEKEYFDDRNQLNEHVLPFVLEPLSFVFERVAFFVLVGMLVSSVFMLIYGYRDYGIKAVRIEKDIIVINNVAYPSGNLEMINGLIKAGRIDRAVNELRWLINMSETEATAIVQKWDEYCG